MPTPVVLSWSGGKDSALALHALSQDASVEVVGLLTTMTDDYDRVGMHGVRRSLLEAQGARFGLPVFQARIKAKSSNEEYEASFLAALREMRARRPDVRHVAFGDLFLEDVRRYRETLLARTDWQPLFPIWGEDTAALARRFISDGFAARLVCVDTTQLDGAFAGRSYDAELLRDLPGACDPCGERVLRDERFMYCDLL